MNTAFRSFLSLSALALLGLPASARTTMPNPRMAAGAMCPMMSAGNPIMREMMADPVVRKRMLAIVKKHGNANVGMGSMHAMCPMPTGRTTNAMPASAPHVIESALPTVSPTP